MLSRLKTPLGLRAHAFVICLAMVTLVSVLGTRAYLTARAHFKETRELIEGDAEARDLISKIDTAQAALEVAQKKLKVTGAFQYERLVSQTEQSLLLLKSSLADVLANTYPDLRERSDLEALRGELEIRRQQKLGRAHADALGLLREILAALVLSIGVSLWLMAFLYRSLIRPVADLKEATQKIRSGDLSYRIPSETGAREFRELAASFNAMAEKLEQLEDTKNEFLATISHEFKNPLAALKEGLALLSNRGEFLSPESKNKAFAASIIASKRLESMMMNLLCHTRMEKGLYQFDLSRKDLAVAISTAIEEVSPIAAKKGMRMEYKGARPVFSAFNWDGIIQVMENLLLNAIKYGRENSPIEIDARVRTDVDVFPVAEIRVRNRAEREDMAGVDLNSIFDRFYRGNNVDGKQGLGLGLHVVKKVVEAHKGSVHVERHAETMEFTIQIPAQYESPSEIPQYQPPPNLTLV
jgi:signal transduction histidine kinase